MKTWCSSRFNAIAIAALCAGLALGVSQAVADTVTIKGEIVVSAELNPNYRGRPSPVNLILYQLTAADGFQNADFFALYDAESGVLGGDLIARNERLVQPGMEEEVELEFDEEARYIGVVAAFRDIENAQWRALVELPQKGFFRSFFSRSKLFIELDALAVNVVLD